MTETSKENANKPGIELILSWVSHPNFFQEKELLEFKNIFI